MILLDTSAVIELLKGTIKGMKIQTLVGQEKVGVTVITLNEALKGEEKKRDLVVSFFQGVNIIPFDETSAWKSAEIEQELYKRGKPLGKLDLFIASICITNNLSLISTDEDFKNVPHLKLILAS